MDKLIYLDHNATTPILPEVFDAMLPYLREHFGNPSSNHPLGRRARDAIERARAQVAALLGSAPDEIVFTSGGTEANNLALHGVAGRDPSRRGLVTSCIEHPATSNPVRALEGDGFVVTRLGVDATGRVDAASDAIDERTTLVSIMHANNETGVLQPVAQLAKQARAHGAIVHTDAAQSVGKVPIDVEALGVDLLSVAGHKLYAPKGVGALFVRRGTVLRPFVRGAGHERGLRPGTENVASIVGLGVACDAAARDLKTEGARLTGLRERLWTQLAEAVPGLRLNGDPHDRLPNTLNVRFAGVSGTALLARCPEIAASTGSACHDGGEAPSSVITSMGVPALEALGSVRLTLGRHTTEAEIDAASALLAVAWRSLSPLAVS